jgi:hypothetical protein
MLPTPQDGIIYFLEIPKRREKIPLFLFAEIVHKQNELVAKGVDSISMAVGAPDKLTFSRILCPMPIDMLTIVGE